MKDGQPEADSQQRERERERERERDRAIADALGHIKVYVESGRRESFIQIKPPQLTRFQLPSDTDKDPQDLMESDEVEDTAVERWNSSEVLQVDLIKEQDMEQLGKTLTDELTGEHYMLLPIDIDILIDPDTLTTDKEPDFEQDLYGVETYFQNPEEQESQEPGSQYCRHEFKVPKLSLNFKLVLESESAEAKDSKLNIGLD